MSRILVTSFYRRLDQVFQIYLTRLFAEQRLLGKYTLTKTLRSARASQHSRVMREYNAK